MKLSLIIAKTACPTCGQAALKVVRRALARSEAPQKLQLVEDCMDCLLKREQGPAKAYYLRQWRIMWISAGGKLEDMPDAIRLPDDPPRRPRPAAADVPFVRPARTPNKRGADTPSWKSPARVLPPPQYASARPKILFVSHELTASGAPMVLANFLPHLRGMDATLYSLAGGVLRDEVLRRGIKLTEHYHPEAYDLIVVNTLAAHSAVSSALAAKIPVLWWNHEWSTAPFLTEEQYYDLAKKVRLNLFVHQAQREQFAFAKEIREAIVHPIIPPFGVPNKHRARQEVGLAAEDVVVLNFGRNEPRKGPEDVLFAKTIPGIKVHNFGNEPNARLWLAAADVYLSTSRAECYGLSVQEAKMAKLPVVATNLPCYRDMIESGVNGYLYEPGDTEMLKELLERLRDDADLRDRLGSAPIRGPRFDCAIEALEHHILNECGGGTARPEELRVVFHIAGMGEHYQAIVSEQLRQLRESGLKRVLVTHCGEGLSWLLETGASLGMDLTVCSHTDEVTCYERPAMELIERLAATSDVPIFYLHSKGVSYASLDSVAHEWRRLFMDELVPYWRQHVAALREYDAVGVNWWTIPDKDHFSGNFWFARPSWIRQLPHFADYYRDRYSCERWIGAKPGCKAKSLLCHDAAFWDRDRNMLQELRNMQIARKNPHASVTAQA